MKKITHTILFALIMLLFFVSIINAQSISLSITPPLFEVMIMPGKEVTQRYTLTNTGSETVIKVSLVPFTPGDSYGNVELQEELLGYDLENVESWFTLLEPDIKMGGKFLLPRGGAKDVILQITPPETAPEGDYYFTLLFETSSEGLVGQRVSSSKAAIGSNVLLTVSKDGNPTKIAKIREFSAPILVDSLGELIFDVTISNVGSAFFKPNGNITVKPLFGSPINLQLAPQNILTSSERNISCIDGEELVECELDNKVLFGLYMATLRFQADEDPQIYEETKAVVAFPFMITVAIITVFAVLKMIRTFQKK